MLQSRGFQRSLPRRVRRARRLALAAPLLVVTALAGSSCGARTALGLPEPCGREGDTRECRNGCGEGTQVCRGGFWNACEVPTVEEACENRCGAGVRVCDDGVFGDCQVPPAQFPCEDVCGAGSQSCVDGRLGVCEVPVATRTCQNACGRGFEECREGSWQGECLTPEITRPCRTVCGEGVETCRDGVFARCTAPRPGPPLLVGTVRDFRSSHPDFELDFNGLDLGIVDDELDADDKPVYAGRPTTPSTTGESNFFDWYHDVPGVNLGAATEIQFAESPDTDGLFVFENRAFFPIDGELFGNEGNSHNYHFTLEVSTEFEYIGGEIFSFSGDDDLWVFINRRLALDLGGVHVTESGTVVLDLQAARLGIEIGERYPLHLFFAERHTVASTFVVRTTIADGFTCP